MRLAAQRSLGPSACDKGLARRGPHGRIAAGTNGQEGRRLYLVVTADAPLAGMRTWRGGPAYTVRRARGDGDARVLRAGAAVAALRARLRGGVRGVVGVRLHARRVAV